MCTCIDATLYQIIIFLNKAPFLINSNEDFDGFVLSLNKILSLHIHCFHSWLAKGFIISSSNSSLDNKQNTLCIVVWHAKSPHHYISYLWSSSPSYNLTRTTIFLLFLQVLRAVTSLPLKMLRSKNSIVHLPTHLSPSSLLFHINSILLEWKKYNNGSSWLLSQVVGIPMEYGQTDRYYATFPKSKVPPAFPLLLL